MFHCCLYCTTGFNQHSSRPRGLCSNWQYKQQKIHCMDRSHLGTKNRDATRIFFLQHVLSHQWRVWQQPTSCPQSGVADRDKTDGLNSSPLSRSGKLLLMHTNSANFGMSGSASLPSPQDCILSLSAHMAA